MNRYISIVILIFMLSCDNSEIGLGEQIFVDKGNMSKVFLPSGELVSKLDTFLNDVRYTIGLKEDKVVFISSSDKSLNLNGISTSTDLAKLKEITQKSVLKIRGWGYYLPLGNNWYAGFDFQKEPRDSNTINWFFKYNFLNENKNP